MTYPVWSGTEAQFRIFVASTGLPPLQFTRVTRAEQLRGSRGAVIVKTGTWWEAESASKLNFEVLVNACEVWHAADFKRLHAIRVGAVS